MAAYALLEDLMISMLTAVFWAIVMSTIAVENKHACNQRMNDFRHQWAGFCGRSMATDAQHALVITVDKAQRLVYEYYM